MGFYTEFVDPNYYVELYFDFATGAISTPAGRILGYVHTIDQAVLAFPDITFTAKNLREVFKTP